MPRYFFHLHDELDCEDEEGVELAGVDAARAFALAEAREVAGEEVKQGHLHLDHHIEVTDADGHRVADVAFADAIAIRGTGCSA